MSTVEKDPSGGVFFGSMSQALGPELTTRVQARLVKLYAECEMPQNSTLRWHLRDNILPGLALYQLLREDGNSQEAALASIDRYFEAGIPRSRKRMKFLGRFPFAFSLLRVFIKPVMRQYPPEGWETEWVENSRQAVRFHMKRCYYQDTLSRYGAPELTASFCRLDDLVYGEMSSYLEWKRTQTIGRGAALCDFCFARAARK